MRRYAIITVALGLAYISLAFVANHTGKELIVVLGLVAVTPQLSLSTRKPS